MSDIFFPIFMSGKKDSNWYLKIPPSGKSSWKPLNISYNSLSSYLEKIKICLTLTHFVILPLMVHHPVPIIQGQTGLPQQLRSDVESLLLYLGSSEDVKIWGADHLASNNYLPAAHGPSHWSQPRYSVEIRGLASTTCHLRYCFIVLILRLSVSTFPHLLGRSQDIFHNLDLTICRK